MNLPKFTFFVKLFPRVHVPCWNTGELVLKRLQLCRKKLLCLDSFGQLESELSEHIFVWIEPKIKNANEYNKILV